MRAESASHVLTGVNIQNKDGTFNSKDSRNMTWSIKRNKKKTVEQTFLTHKIMVQRVFEQGSEPPIRKLESERP